jgi:hypothetical protein
MCCISLTASLTTLNACGSPHSQVHRVLRFPWTRKRKVTLLSSLPLSYLFRPPLSILMMSSTPPSLIQTTPLTPLLTRQGSGISATSVVGTASRWVLSGAVARRIRKASISVSLAWLRPTMVYPMVQQADTSFGKVPLAPHCGRRMTGKLHLSITLVPLQYLPSFFPFVMGSKPRLLTNIQILCRTWNRSILVSASPVSKSARKETLAPIPTVMHLPLYLRPTAFITPFLRSHR